MFWHNIILSNQLMFPGKYQSNVSYRQQKGSICIEIHENLDNPPLPNGQIDLHNSVLFDLWF